VRPLLTDVVQAVTPLTGMSGPRANLYRLAGAVSRRAAKRIAEEADGPEKVTAINVVVVDPAQRDDR
jgi:hypothetical protein